MNEEVKQESAHIHSRADELIACLEGEIAKRDAKYQREVYGLNNESDPIGGDPAGGYANDNLRLRAELAAIKAQEPVRYWFIGDAGQEKGSRHCKKSSQDGSLAFFESEFDAKRAARRHAGTEVYTAEYYAAPVSEAKAQGVVMPAELARAFITGESCDGVYSVVIQSETLKEMHAVHRWITSFNAAPAAPTADAGLVEVLEKLARLGNGDQYGNSDGNMIAQAALSAHRAKGVV